MILLPVAMEAVNGVHQVEDALTNALCAAAKSGGPAAGGLLSDAPYTREMYTSKRGRHYRKHRAWAESCSRTVVDALAYEVKQLTAIGRTLVAQANPALAPLLASFMGDVVRDYAASITVAFRARQLPPIMERRTVHAATLVNCEVRAGSGRIVVGRRTLDEAADMLADGRIESICAASPADYRAEESEPVPRARSGAVVVRPQAVTG